MGTSASATLYLLLHGSGAQLETAVFYFPFEKINVYIQQGGTCLALELPEHEEGAHRTRPEGPAYLGLPSGQVPPLSGFR